MGHAFFLSTMVLTVFISSMNAHAQEKKVLVLHSYGPEMSWVRSIDQGIEDKLLSSSMEINIQTEFMDTKRYNDLGYYSNLIEIYKYKYFHQKFDVVISSDNNAFDFLLEHGGVLFPGTPVVFCGVNNFQEKMLDGHPLFTGVAESVAFGDTIEEVLKIHPDVKRIHIFGAPTPTWKSNRDLFLRESQPFRSEVELKLGEGFDIPKAQEYIRSLKDGDIVLLTSVYRDEHGNLLSFEKSTQEITKVSDVPVYGFWTFQLGHGIVGGKLINGFAQGEAAASLALRILEGESVQNIPVILKSPNREMFDYQQLQKKNISEADIPDGSIVINQPYSFYGENKMAVWFAVVVFLTLSAIILLLVVNILIRRKFSRQLLKSKERYQLLVENQTDLIVKVDKDFKFLYVSPSYCKLFGKEQEELLGKNFMPLVHEDDRESTEKAMEALHVSPHTDYHEQRAMTKDGWKWLAWSDTAVLNDDGEIEAIIGGGRDIDEKKKAEELFLQTEKMVSLGELAAGMAHEINNPLGIILQAVQSAHRRISPDFNKNIEQAQISGVDLNSMYDYLDNRGVAGYLDGIYEAGERASIIVNNMLDFCRQDGSVLELLSVHDVLNEALKLSYHDYSLKKKIDIKKIGFVKEYTENLPDVLLSKTEIEQVFMNLIKNAAQAMAESGLPGEGKQRVALRTGVAGESIVIEVEDNGPGIAEDIRTKIFEPFFTTKAPGVGTGLGLSVSYFIITKNHNGTIEVFSEPGQGTRFVVKLPMEK